MQFEEGPLLLYVCAASAPLQHSPSVGIECFDQFMNRKFHIMYRNKNVYMLLLNTIVG